MEPQPNAFQQLRETYKSQSSLVLKNAAIAEVRSTRSLFGFRDDDPDVPRWLSQVASFDKRHLAKFRPCWPSHRRRDFRSLVVEWQVDCITMEDALRELGETTIYLLQIDAEGHDWPIIRSIDLSVTTPAVIRYESRHMGAEHAAACIENLAAHGYRFIPDGHDTIAYRPPPRGRRKR